MSVDFLSKWPKTFSNGPNSCYLCLKTQIQSKKACVTFGIPSHTSRGLTYKENRQKKKNKESLKSSQLFWKCAQCIWKCVVFFKANTVTLLGHRTISMKFSSILGEEFYYLEGIISLFFDFPIYFPYVP